LDRPRIAGCGAGGSGGSVIGRWNEQSVTEESFSLSDPEALVRMLSQLDSRSNKVERLEESSQCSSVRERERERERKALEYVVLGLGEFGARKHRPEGWSRCKGTERHSSRYPKRSRCREKFRIALSSNRMRRARKRG
jgi:hypothetical protein